jgi:hypothetical protein
LQGVNAGDPLAQQHASKAKHGQPAGQQGKALVGMWLGTMQQLVETIHFLIQGK